MKKDVVSLWLLERANDDLVEAVEEYKESLHEARDYKNRVKDPAWNLVYLGKGEETWGADARRYARKARRNKRRVDFLRSVVKKLKAMVEA